MIRTRLANLWEKLRSSYWFVPTVMAAAAVGLALGTVAVDHRLEGETVEKFGYLYTGAAEGARGLLSTIAGSIITVAGVVFSITVAALTLASSQFGPRLLRNFMRDLGNQVVLGTFVSTYIYCLLVLRTVRGENGDESEGGFVPHLSVTIGVVLAAASLVVLIYFIHHIALSMQAPMVIAAVADDLRHGIDELFPEKLGREDAGGNGEAGRDAGDATPPTPEVTGSAADLPARHDGYLQSVDDGRLLELARRHDLVLRLLRRPGDYVIKDQPLVQAWPGERADESVRKEVEGAFTYGPERTPTQDVTFPLDQLVEVAVRAMSTGINDPFTAVTCVDRLGSALSQLAGRRLPSPYRRDREGRLRVIAPPVSFEGILSASVGPILEYARGSNSTLVTRRLREMLLGVAEHTRDAGRRAALLREAEGVASASQPPRPSHGAPHANPAHRA